MVLVFLTDRSEELNYSRLLNNSLGNTKWRIVDQEKSIKGSEKALLLIGSQSQKSKDKRKKELEKIFKKAIENNLKIIGIEYGMFLVNEMLGGGEPFKNVQESSEIFIGLGTKLANIIGGSGNVKVLFERTYAIEMKKKANSLQASAININTGFIEAIEIKGKGNILGVLWPVLGETKLPKGFKNIIDYIVD